MFETERVAVEFVSVGDVAEEGEEGDSNDGDADDVDDFVAEWEGKYTVL